MFEYITILLLHTAFFLYLNFTSYAWLNKVYPITKRMLYYLTAAFVALVLVHLLWPGIERVFSSEKLAVLLCFSGALFFFHYFGRKAVSNVDDLEKRNVPNPAFYNFGRKFFTLFFLRLFPFAITICQLGMIWFAGNF
jgi:hypothetical protein